jgi:hypothetical protein
VDATATAPEFRVSGAFRDDIAARSALAAFQDAGFAPGVIAVHRELARDGTRGETSFLGRLVWIIVFWSIPGTIVGALAGWGIAVLAGIDDTTGIVLMVVAFAIFGHLIAGIWAGYVLLADRSEREFSAPGERGRTVLEVRCRNREELERARQLMDQSGATGVRQTAI